MDHQRAQRLVYLLRKGISILNLKTQRQYYKHKIAMSYKTNINNSDILIRLMISTKNNAGLDCHSCSRINIDNKSRINKSYSY